MIIVNINKDENKSLISNQFSEELFCGGKNLKVKNDHTSFLRENWFEMSDLFSSLLIFTIIKTILSTFFYCFKILQKSCKLSVDRDKSGA